jgi:hypothetical protein
MRIFTVEEVLNDLENCIIEQKPFSLLRYGDGGIKFIHSIIFDDYEQLNEIIIKEGIPRNHIIEILELWGYYGRQANYIDTPEVYFSNKFWPRLKGPDKPMSLKTRERLLMWKELYNRAEIDNNNFCNPEINFLSILRRSNKRNLFDIMKDRKICCITTFPDIKDVLVDHSYNIDVLKIVGQYENQYDNSFKDIISIIKERANNYDLWLVAGGELGRLYTGYIKQLGGRAFDIGFVIEYWLELDIPVRLRPFVKQNPFKRLELLLKSKGYKFNRYI